MDDLRQFEDSESEHEHGPSWMPPVSPLHIMPQRFDRLGAVRHKHPTSLMQMAWRFLAFAPPLTVSLVLVIGFTNWLSSGGVMALEATLIALVAMTFVWVSLSVTSVLIGVLRSLCSAPVAPAPKGQGCDIALTMLTYNEDPVPVFANALAMAESLAKADTNHRFSFFLLSDTQDPVIAQQEQAVFMHMKARAPLDIPMFYRRREKNTDRKIGNIADWLGRWGGTYEGFLVLDADSLMSADAICGLADRLESDEDAGLIQSFPRLIGAQTIFARMQEYASFAYGTYLSKGLAAWAQNDGNYWGHNAIIRCKAFAQSAHLPRLGRAQSLILSHDFVEAALLRRAGWKVYFDEAINGSYEETPPSLIDHAIRDRRWCRGNLQHLRLLGARGLSWVSRFHLLQGAVGFLLAPAWLILILIWSALELVPMEEHAYFNAANPLYPVWPMMSELDGGMFLALIYGMLLLPKILGALGMMGKAELRRIYGGRMRIALVTAGEITLSIIYAPVLMIQQTRAVLMALYGRAGWAPQSRDAETRSWGATIRFHWIETVLGGAMIAGCAVGVLSVWLMPVATSLILAVPLSRFSAVSRLTFGMIVPDSVSPPPERQHALQLREILAARVKGMSDLATTKPHFGTDRVLSGRITPSKVVASPQVR